ncbi:hypothetical protein ES703_125997 [subsurface metagenome]
MLNQVFYDLELEKCQAGMLRAVKHSEEIRIREFICFLGAFHNYLTIPRKMFGEEAVPGFTGAKKWLKVMAKYTKMVGIPEGMVGHLQTALERGDVYLLDWVLTQSMKGLYAFLDSLR